MSLFGFIEYAEAGPEVRAVYDDIMATRKVDWINNFWKAIANDPVLLKRTWESIKQIMAPGALDPLVKEMLYVAVSVTNGCDYMHCFPHGGSPQKWNDSGNVPRTDVRRRHGQRNQSPVQGIPSRDR